jgi:hypothetical protein
MDVFRWRSAKQAAQPGFSLLHPAGHLPVALPVRLFSRKVVCRRGSFSTRAEAVREAVIAAHAVQQTGQSVEVLVFADFEPYSVWSSDRDGYVSLR